jgi:hypothetical protein
VPEPSAGRGLQLTQPIGDQWLELRRLLTVGQVGAAGFGGDDETVRHRKPQPRHLRQVCAFPPQQVDHASVAIAKAHHQWGGHVLGCRGGHGCLLFEDLEHTALLSLCRDAAPPGHITPVTFVPRPETRGTFDPIASARAGDNGLDGQRATGGPHESGNTRSRSCRACGRRLRRVMAKRTGGHRGRQDGPRRGTPLKLLAVERPSESRGAAAERARSVARRPGCRHTAPSLPSRPTWSS